MNIPEPLYRQILESLPIACVDVAIVHKGAILLVKRADKPVQGEWWLPGGRVHKGEMMREAAIRKAQQETGLTCHAGPIIHTAETIFPDGPGGIPVHSINSCFLLYPAGEPVIRLDAHHSSYEWANHIWPGLHTYVRDCLLKAGLVE